MNFLTAEEINNYKPNFNPRLMTQEYLDEILSQIDKNPVWYESNRDISKKPDTHAGICICRNCRQIYWITQLHDAYGKIRTQGKTIQGPFCEKCSDDIGKELLKRQR